MKLRTTDSIYDSANDLYSDNLFYHNFDHVNETIANAEKILEECDRKSISYDEKIVCHAILFHDAGYHVNHVKKGFESKESYSAYLAENILSNHGETKKHIEEVVSAILCTQIDAACDSYNQMIVRAADLLGLISPYMEFKSKSVALFYERELLSGEKITWEQYKNEAFKIIHNFLKPKINLDIELFSKGNYMFHAKVFHNLDTLMKDTID